jgi:hypothetical protein
MLPKTKIAMGHKRRKNTNPLKRNGAQGRNRTTDTRIFSFRYSNFGFFRHDPDRLEINDLAPVWSKPLCPNRHK